jgi:hypothetical protein
VSASIPLCFTTNSLIALSEALKIAGYSVYDAASASANHIRDFPLWNEALQAKLAGTPFGRREFDKLTGRYNALVGGPATVFADDLLKAYPDAKVIVVDGFQNLTFLKYLASLNNSIAKSVIKWLDPTFFGAVSQFSESFQDALTTALTPVIDYTTIIPEKKLLKLQAAESWDPLCKFLEIATPQGPFPSKAGNMLRSQASFRLRYIANTAIRSLALGFLYTVMSISVGLAGFITCSRILDMVTMPSASLGLLAFLLTSATFIHTFTIQDTSNALASLAPKPAPERRPLLPQHVPKTTTRLLPPRLRGKKKGAAAKPPRAAPTGGAWGDFTKKIRNDDVAAVTEAKKKDEGFKHEDVVYNTRWVSKKA